MYNSNSKKNNNQGETQMKRNKINMTIIVFVAMLSLLLVTACDTDMAPSSEPIAETSDAEQIHEFADADESAENNDPAEEAPSAEPRSEKFFQRGVWENNIFKSEYLGLNFLLPDGWHIASDSDIADVMGVSIDIMEQAAEFDLSELMDISAIDAIYDMMASSLAGANVIITYERLVFPFTRISEIEYIETAAEMMAEMGVHVHFDNSEPTRIGNYDWYSFSTSMVIEEMEILGRQFINIHDGFARIIIISYNDMTESVDEILHMFFGLNDPTPEPLHVARAEVLVGSWEWDFDASYTYVFYADGQGSRGLPDEKEYFSWRVRGYDNLIIDDGASIESWTFSIDADILTIHSAHIPGMIFHYIRIS